MARLTFVETQLSVQVVKWLHRLFIRLICRVPLLFFFKVPVLYELVQYVTFVEWIVEIKALKVLY